MSHTNPQPAASTEAPAANGRYQNGHTANGHAPAATMPPTAVATDPVRDDGRYRRILIFFGRIILHIIGFDLLLGRIPLVKSWVRRTRPERFRNWARRFRLLALDMGGVMIKLGQFLSARVDVLPVEIIEELKDLQDEVPAEQPARMFAVLAAELGDLSTIFANIEETPMAAASLGQTHRAWLRNANGRSASESVVVKIQRPGIASIVETDLAALQIVAQWVMRYRPIARRADVPALMREFAATLWEELDYHAEADNAERFATIHATDDNIYIPAIYRDYCTSRVIVMENVESIKITDIAAMTAAGISPQAVADTLLTTYFKQIFRVGFFHADPHPGNLFVRPKPNWEPTAVSNDGTAGRPFWLIFIDFGMVGRVPEIQGELLSKVLVSVAQRNPQGLTEAYSDLGFFLPDADLERITEAQGVILDRIYGRNLLDLTRPDPQEVLEIGQEFRDLLFDFPLQVPQDFIYLGRAIGMVSGLVSLLDDQINPWAFFERFGRELVQEKAVKQFNLKTAANLLRPYLNTPERIQRLISDAENGRLRVQTVPDKATVQRQERLEKRLGQLSWSILGGAGIISATLLYLTRRK